MAGIWSGQLNLHTSALVLQATTANKAATLSTLASQLLSGKNNGTAGTWSGPGIISSSAAANPAQ